MNTTFFFFSCILCAFFLPPLQTVYTPLVFFLLWSLPSLCNTDNTPFTSLGPFSIMDADLSLVISSTGLEVGGISSLNMFCSRPPFFVCVTC